MAKTLRLFVLVGVWHIAMIAHGAQPSSGHIWEKKEMDPRVNSPIGPMLKIEDVNLLPTDAPDPGNPHCTATSPCTFDLFYTNGAQFDLNKVGKLNILFISGGPGQFIDEGDGPGESTAGDPPKGNSVLDLLAFGEDSNGRHNIVYFHVRGTGQSSRTFKRTNNYDKFLRARYVVEDIERIRKQALNGKAWDAIYAHSWGTVVAQLYASRFASEPEPRVKSLILSAPVVRKDPKTAEARIKQTLSNLEDIYTFFKPAGDCVISDPSYLKNRVVDFNDLLPVGDLARSDNLCFISEPRVSKLRERVSKILSAVEADYGSVAFVEDHFEEISADLPSELKMPREFYAALRKLQFLGAPKEDGLIFTADVKSMIDISLVIGFHLTPGVDSSGGVNCDPDAKFFVGAARDPNVKKEYCNRLTRASRELLRPDKLESIRANYVFGLYDGIARWVFKMLGKECFTGTDLTNFANASTGSNDKKRLARAIAKKIGLGPDGESPVCGWDPGAGNAHSVPTLIMAGNSDTVIAGCQAEDFYNRGLKGPKVFLQLPGQGHGMSVANQDVLSKQTEALANLIEQFIKTAGSNPSRIGKFLDDVESEVNAVKARKHPNLQDASITCP